MDSGGQLRPLIQACCRLLETRCGRDCSIPSKAAEAVWFGRQQTRGRPHGWYCHRDSPSRYEEIGGTSVSVEPPCPVSPAEALVVEWLGGGEEGE
jgi:hypothetical protein